MGIRPVSSIYPSLPPERSANCSNIIFSERKLVTTNPPSCPNPDRCGSCGYSIYPYEEQLRLKLAAINEALAPCQVECKEILPSPEQAHYRNRMDFVIDFEGRMGLREKGKWWKVIDDHTCFLSDTKIEKAFHQARDWVRRENLSYFDRKRHTGFLRYVVLRSTSTGELMLSLVTSAPTAEDEIIIETEFAELVKSVPATTHLWSINNTISDVSFGDDVRTIAGPGYIEECISDCHYRVSPNAFFQVNPHTAKLLLETVLEFSGDVASKTVLDLYCGTGFFAIALAKSAERTLGVEIVEDAITDAKINCELNSVEVDFQVSEAEKFDWGTLCPDVVIVDPPRSGLHKKTRKALLKAKPKKMVYVSCNYKNLASELPLFQSFYSIENIRAIDMFPQTPHVELVISLVRKGE